MRNLGGLKKILVLLYEVLVIVKLNPVKIGLLYKSRGYRFHKFSQHMFYVMVCINETEFFIRNTTFLTIETVLIFSFHIAFHLMY